MELKMNPVIHFELPAENRKRMAEFYTKVFGWTAQMMGEDMGNYTTVQTAETDPETRMIKKPGAINGGFFEKGKENPMQHPSIVISVENLEKHMQTVKANGGTIIGEPIPIPGVGKYVVFQDTEGNYLSMIQPEMPQQ